MIQKRNQRALKAIRTLKAQQQKQATQIDILCRDMVKAHDLFSRTLSQLTFAALFYETLLSCDQLEGVIDQTIALICSNIDRAGTAIFLVEPSGFEVYVAASVDGGQVEKTNFQNWNLILIKYDGKLNRHTVAVYCLMNL